MNNRLERNLLSGQKEMSPLCNHMSELKSTLSFTEISVQILHSRTHSTEPSLDHGDCQSFRFRMKMKFFLYKVILIGIRFIKLEETLFSPPSEFLV